jgi:hypothetical protein
MRGLLILVALSGLGLSALFALPRIVSVCEHESAMPALGIAAVFLAIWAAAGVYVIAKGDAAQRVILFAGIFLILLGYGVALSMILPDVLGRGCG